MVRKCVRIFLLALVLAALLPAPASSAGPLPPKVYLPLIGGAEMTHGTGSTLIIYPYGQTALTMAVDGNPETSTYIVPLQMLNFNEEGRWRVVYSQAAQARGEGGVAVSEYGPLVPVQMTIVIKAATRAAMIEAYNSLMLALINKRGGTIEYKPEDVPASALSTFYWYVQSEPPRLAQQAGNRWDAGAKSDGRYTLIVDTEWMTQPIATSDPDSPVALADLVATIQNWIDDAPAQTNSVMVDAADLKGSMPALLRVTARPGAGQSMGELIMYKRDEGTLANFVSIYEAEDAAQIPPSVAWTDIPDADRGGGHYMRCLPGAGVANGEPQGLRFTIANPGDHEGRFAVFGVGHTISNGWTHQVKLRVGNVIQASADDYEIASLGEWQLIYAGEFELPPAPLSDAEMAYAEGPYVEWYATRESGTSEFDLDGIILVYVADSALQPTALDVPCEDEDGGGVTNAERLLVENFPDDYGQAQELVHIVTQAALNFQRIPVEAPRGDFLMLDPTKDNLLVFIQQRSRLLLFSDDFEAYKNIGWVSVEKFDTSDDWIATAAEDDPQEDDVHYVESGSSIRTTIHGVALPNPVTVYRNDLDIDMERNGTFTADDFICYAIYSDDNAGFTVNINFVNDDGGYTVGAAHTPAVGYNFYYQAKSGFADSFFSWSDANLIRLNGVKTANPDKHVSWDYIRVEKADPDNIAVPNATGTQWNFQPNAGIWTVTEDVMGAGATLACLDNEAGVEKSALIDETTPDDVRYRARVMAKRDEGYVGIVWRSGQDTLTEGAEDCYAALLDVANGELLVREYTNGAITQHAHPGFLSAADTWYVIGVSAIGSTFNVYAKKASLLADDDDVFDDAYLRATVVDATYTTGQCGVMSISTLGRFDDVLLEGIQDRHIPADEIELNGNQDMVSGKVIFRTIAPFNE